MQSFLSKKRESYHRNSKPPLGRIVFGVLCALLIIYLGRGMIGGAVSALLKPLYVLESRLSDATYFADKDTLRAEIFSLEEELRVYGMESEEITQLRAENKELRGVLGRGEDAERIVVSVIAQPPRLPYDAVLIDAGEDEGIQVGAIAYHYGQRAVGMVSRVYAHSALVTLFSTPDVSTTVYILGPDIFTTAYGVGDGTIRVSVPQDISIAEGDVAILPALDGGILGTITTVDTVPTEPEQHGYIVADASLQSLRMLSIARDVIDPVTFEQALMHIEAHTLLSVPVPEDIIIDIATSTVKEI